MSVSLDESLDVLLELSLSLLFIFFLPNFATAADFWFLLSTDVIVLWYFLLSESKFLVSESTELSNVETFSTNGL